MPANRNSPQNGRIHMAVSCPICGGEARPVNRFNHTVESTEFEFQCEGKSCGSFSGVLVLSRKGVNGAEHFRSQDPSGSIVHALTDF